MKNTIDAIVDATDKPLSIIIIGIGNESFDNMDILDADEKQLKSSCGTEMKRDIVQFVPFRKFKIQAWKDLKVKCWLKFQNKFMNFVQGMDSSH